MVHGGKALLFQLRCVQDVSRRWAEKPAWVVAGESVRFLVSNRLKGAKFVPED